jgi:hypothetical protein
LKAVKVFGILILAVQLTSFVAFTLSFHTVFAVAQSIVSGDTLSYNMVMDESTGVGELRIEISPMNSGYLGVDLALDVGVLDKDDNYIAWNSTFVHLDAGERKPLMLSLHLPATKLLEMMLDGRSGFLEVTLNMRTFNDLVGISNTLRVEGGGP